MLYCIHKQTTPIERHSAMSGQLKFKALWVVEVVGGREVKVPDQIEVDSIPALEEFLQGNEDYMIELISQKTNLPIASIKYIELKLNTD